MNSETNCDDKLMSNFIHAKLSCRNFSTDSPVTRATLIPKIADVMITMDRLSAVVGRGEILHEIRTKLELLNR